MIRSDLSDASSCCVRHSDGDCADAAVDSQPSKNTGMSIFFDRDRIIPFPYERFRHCTFPLASDSRYRLKILSVEHLYRDAIEYRILAIINCHQ